MANFDIYAPRLKRWEGWKYADDPDDYGGATKAGVTLATFRSVFGAEKTKADLRNMTEGQWRTIMKGLFWDRCKADKIQNQSVAEIFVDWCINSGVGKIKMAQQLLDVAADGVVGPATLAAINANGQRFHRLVKLTRAKRFISQIEANPRQMKYFDGWMARLLDFDYVVPREELERMFDS